jgi:cellulose synthase/poly-beta-1,6-N-acetylglucosamine synthase-like glycosyltransferase
MIEIVSILDWVLFVCSGISVAYLCFFAFLSLNVQPHPYPKSKKKSRILVLFPAHKEDQVIELSVQSFLEQDYPKELYHLVVISDQMQEETLERLKKYPIEVLPIENKNKTKAKALQLAVQGFHKEEFDVVAILDADNIVQTDFLSLINNAYHAGVQAMQGQRIAKNSQTDTALLDAASEAMNNSFFRKGQIQIGFSATLSGSGMAFDFKWFQQHIHLVTTAGEDKELEKILLKQEIFIDYIDELLVFDEKTADTESFSRQRRRWLAAQYGTLKRALNDLPGAIFTRNSDYCNKLFQWMMLPRVLLLGLIVCMSFVLLILHWQWSIKWWMLLLGLIMAFSMAIPDEMFDKRLIKALTKVPYLFLLMFINLFRLKGVNKSFIHTRTK